LWSIPVPLPTKLRYVTSYVFETDEGCRRRPRMEQRAGMDTFVQGLATIGANPADTTAIIATHMHGDHYGLAGNFGNASDATDLSSPADAASLEHRFAPAGRPGLRRSRPNSAPGVPERRERIEGGVPALVNHSEMVAPDKLLEGTAISRRFLVGRSRVCSRTYSWPHLPLHRQYRRCFWRPRPRQITPILVLPIHAARSLIHRFAAQGRVVRS